MDSELIADFEAAAERIRRHTGDAASLADAIRGELTQLMYVLQVNGSWGTYRITWGVRLTWLDDNDKCDAIADAFLCLLNQKSPAKLLELSTPKVGFFTSPLPWYFERMCRRIAVRLKQGRRSREAMSRLDLEDEAVAPIATTVEESPAVPCDDLHTEFDAACLRLLELHGKYKSNEIAVVMNKEFQKSPPWTATSVRVQTHRTIKKAHARLGSQALPQRARAPCS